MNNILFGAVCLDIYTNSGVVLPGCGILHNAFHLQQLDCVPQLITRIGTVHSDVFLRFFRTHRIAILPECVTTPGHSASIEVTVQESGEAVMSNFNPGVWAKFKLQPAEETLLAQAGNLHTVLIDGVVDQFTQLGRRELLKNRFVSADFLSFSYFKLDSFTHLLQYIDLAFIGWKGEIKHPTLTAIQHIAARQQKLIVVTLGQRGVQVFDGRKSPQFYEVQPVAVQDNTNGCGDAFISYFLADYWRHRNLAQAVKRGKIGGAAATRWSHALPPIAYHY